jgi:hypothetical protein
MRVLVCGSRTFEDEHDVLQALVTGLAEIIELSGYMTLIHGNAPGADSLAASAVRTAPAGAAVESYPADWDKYGKAAGPLRNQQMMDEGKPELVIAFIDKPLEDSRGTNNMVTKARAAGLPVYVVERVS